MHMQHTEKCYLDNQPKRSRYRIVNHREAGMFDSMTGATLWALKNLSGWDWQIETVSGGRR
jgi:hypothetical protein